MVISFKLQMKRRLLHPDHRVWLIRPWLATKHQKTRKQRTRAIIWERTLIGSAVGRCEEGTHLRSDCGNPAFYDWPSYLHLHCPASLPAAPAPTAEVVPGICPRRSAPTVGPSVSPRPLFGGCLFSEHDGRRGGARGDGGYERGWFSCRGEFVIEWEDWMKLFHNH